jgi:hypothetical protein
VYLGRHFGQRLKSSVNQNAPNTGVKITMTTYRNSFFKIQLEFTEGWKPYTWSTWKTAPKSFEYRQRSDDDIPTDEKGYKTLFTSIFRIKESPSMCSCEFSMEAHCRKSGFNLELRLPPRDEEISRISETGLVLGMDSQSLKTEHDGGRYISTREVIIWEALPKIWLSACIIGDSKDNFKSARDQFERLVHSE